MGAALRCRDRVAVGLDEAVTRRGPVDGPFDRPGLAELLFKTDFAREWVLRVCRRTRERFGKVVGEAAGKPKAGFNRGLSVIDLRSPTDLDAREQVGFGTRHLEKACGLHGVPAEDLGIGVEGNGRAASVGRWTKGLGRALGNPA